MSMLDNDVALRPRPHRATMKPRPGIPLSDNQKIVIAALFEKLKNPTPAAIARRIGRSAKTVKWHMLTHGMFHSPPHRSPKKHQRTRNGVTIDVFPWDKEQDAFIQARRTTGLSCAKIAAAVTEAFGIERKGHSVRVRLVMLAANPESEVA